MDNSNKKKYKQLGMPIGTATHRLRKSILFALVKFSKIDDLDICFQCGERIEDIGNFSIEHKVPWLDSEDPKELFYDLENIAFSHLSCNIGVARRKLCEHGTSWKYEHHGCRCQDCKDAHAEKVRNYRRRNINR